MSQRNKKDQNPFALETPLLSQQLALIIKEIEKFYQNPKASHDENWLWERFSGLSQNEQMGLVQGALDKWNFLKEATQAKEAPETESNYLQTLISSNGLHIPEDVYRKIDDEDVVELYNRDFIQIYHNQTFVDLCTYSLSELITIPWYELYERPQYCTDYLLKQAHALFQDGFGPQEMQLDPYVLRQLFKNPGKEVILQHKFVCPVQNSKGSTQLLLYVNRIEDLRNQDGKVEIL